MTDEPKKLRKTATLVLRLPPAMVKRLDRIALREFEQRSEIARRALEAGLRQLERKR